MPCQLLIWSIQGLHSASFCIEIILHLSRIESQTVMHTSSQHRHHMAATTEPPQSLSCFYSCSPFSVRTDATPCFAQPSEMSILLILGRCAPEPGTCASCAKATLPARFSRPVLRFFRRVVLFLMHRHCLQYVCMQRPASEPEHSCPYLLPFNDWRVKLSRLRIASGDDRSMGGP